MKKEIVVSCLLHGDVVMLIISKTQCVISMTGDGNGSRVILVLTSEEILTLPGFITKHN